MKKYEEIFQDYKNAILNGTYKSGSKLPTEEKIAQQYGTSRVPVQQAMNALIGSNLVKRVVGSGTYVTYESNLLGAKNLKTVLLITELNPETAQIMEGVQSVLHNCGVFVSTRCSYGDAAVEREVLEQLKNGEIMGLLIYATDTNVNIDLIHELITKRLPLVFVDKLPNDIVCNCVMSDPVLAMQLLVEELYNKGHRRIGVITHDQRKRSSAPLRLKMAEMAMNRLGLELPARYVRSNEDQIRNVTEMMTQPQPPTAIIYTAAVIAYSGHAAYERLGLRVPQDVSVAVYDDIKRFSKAFGLRLTSVAQDYYGIGRVAAERLYQYMVKPDMRFLVEYMPVTFMPGESVQAITPPKADEK